MNIATSISHPAWAHQFRYIIKELEKKGHKVKVFAVNKDRNLELLEKFGISYDLVGNSTGKNFFEKVYLFIAITFRIFRICKKFKPDIFIGRASPMDAINSFLFHKPHIIFEDTEHSKISLFFCKLFSTIIITPFNFQKNLGKNQKRVHVYKELFYLHPNYFTPDISVLKELNIKPDEQFILIRFVAWHASHDFGYNGLNYENKLKAIRKFEKFGRIFITSELPLPEELEKYKINISPEKIHHLIYYATLLYGDGTTMASEAAVLGTHAVVSTITYMGYLKDQQENYDLLYCFDTSEDGQQKSITKAIQLLGNSNLWAEGKIKREKLLSEKMDGTQYMLNVINQYLLIK
jgi:uncharacterized protein